MCTALFYYTCVYIYSLLNSCGYWTLNKYYYYYVLVYVTYLLTRSARQYPYYATSMSYFGYHTFILQKKMCQAFKSQSKL